MKRITLENFRCYKRQTIDFRDGINLLVGDNASGKTSILKACKYILSSFFSGFSDENTKWVNPGVDDFSIVIHHGIAAPEKPIRIGFDPSNSVNSPDQEKTQGDEMPYYLIKKSKKNSRSLISGIKAYKEYASALQDFYFRNDKQEQALPLFASFSTEDIHSKRKIDAAKFRMYEHKPSFGYYECLEGDGFFPYWIKRLLILQEGRGEHPEITIVRKAIGEALGENGCQIINDIQIRPNQKKVYYILTDDREIEADFLSDGYRRLVNIVTDIAFRCALLNRGIYGENASHLTKGTVLIDEVDLHLHPNLQSKVMKGLKYAFPKIQFIISSHAPMVMSGIETNEDNLVYKLDYFEEGGYTVNQTSTYGMDISTITKIILNQTPRPIEVEEQLKRLFDLIDSDNIPEAKSALSEMTARYADTLPELAQAEAMLNFTIFEDEIDQEEQ
ncbi:MAG: AAA family ATPase [Bacteroidales bacterium]